MERIIYRLTEQQIAKIQRINWHMPSDDEIKESAKKSHIPWGLLKRDLALTGLRCDLEYVRGLWQGRVDKARGLTYSEERLKNSYNLGYHHGYTMYESDRNGWDKRTREEFDETYVNL